MTILLKRYYNAGGAWCVLYFCTIIVPLYFIFVPFNTIVLYSSILVPYFFPFISLLSTIRERRRGSSLKPLHLHFLRYFPYHHFRLLSSHTISTSIPFQNSPIPNALPCTPPVSSGAISSLRYSTLFLYPVKQRTIFLSTIFTLLHHPFLLTAVHYCYAVDKRSSIVNCSFVNYQSIITHPKFDTTGLTPRQRFLERRN